MANHFVKLLFGLSLIEKLSPNICGWKSLLKNYYLRNLIFQNLRTKSLRLSRPTRVLPQNFWLQNKEELGIVEDKPQHIKFIKEKFNLRERTSLRPLNRSLYFPTKAALPLSKSPSKLSPVENEVVNDLYSAIPDIRQAGILPRQLRSMLVLNKER